MAENHAILFRDADHLRNHTVQMEVFGDMFVLYADQWRSEAFCFGDLELASDAPAGQTYRIYKGHELRPHWQMKIVGAVPGPLASRLPQPEIPAISRGGMLAIAYLCVGIVHSASNIA